MTKPFDPAERLREMRGVHQSWHLKVSPGLLRSKCYLCKFFAYAEAVGELHKPNNVYLDGKLDFTICWSHCKDEDGTFSTYPCPTAKLGELLKGDGE